VQVTVQGGLVEGLVSCATDRAQGGVRRDVARIGSEQAPDSVRVALDAVDPTHIGVDDHVEVVGVGVEGVCRREPEVVRPTPTASASIASVTLSPCDWGSGAAPSRSD